jgi:endonuclease/exonuclease/phosphatase family metal-dependent hydrolase
LLKNRFPLLLAEILKSINRGDIICLQEVDKPIAELLHPVFIENGYWAPTGHYSSYETKYFNNLVAYPTEKYKLIHYEQIRVANFLSIPKNYTNSALPTPSRTVDCDIYQEAAKRDRCLLNVEFKDKKSGKHFAIYNCHMQTEVMTLHIEAILYIITHDKLPCILIGDFNLLASSPQYKFITTGQITDNIPSPEWKPREVRPLIDLRVQTNFPFLPTNCARNPAGNLFMEAIDHVFCSAEFVNQSITYTPATSPNIDSGSDHVMINCELALL